MQFAIPTRLQFPNGLSKVQKKRLKSWRAQLQHLDKEFLAAGVREAWSTGRAADGDDLRQEGRTLFLTVAVIDPDLPLSARSHSLSTLRAAVQRGIGWPVFVGLHAFEEPPHGGFQVFLRPAVQSPSSSAPPSTAALSASE